MLIGAMSAETILVVEDEEDLRAIIVYHLKREGYHVLETASGEEAVQIIRRDRPAVVLLDLMLPGIDGLRRVKRGQARVDKPIK